MAVFNSPTKQILKNSALLGIINFPIIGMVLIVHVFLLLVADLSAKSRMVVISLLLFFGCAGLAYFFCIFYRRIFNKILKKDETDEGSNEKEVETDDETDSPSL